VSFDFDLFVIGGGSGGTRCARIAATHGARVAVAEARHWGGTCVNVGCVPKKLMVMAAEYGAACEASHAFGWDTKRGRHDWPTLIANKDAEIGRLNGIYRRMLDAAGATLFEAHASLAGPHTLLVDGRRVTAEHIVIATGGRPLRPDFPGQERCIVSDDAFYLPERPRRVTVIGGGYIGVEFAGIFAGLGSEVRLVMRQHLPLRGFDEDIRQALLEALEQQGIAVHSGRMVAALATDGTVRLDDGATHGSDLVFAAVGRTPASDGLGLEAAGVRINGFGAVCVDAQNATDVPGIHAIGDVTDRLNLTPVAIAEGHMLADRLFGPTGRSWRLDQTPTAVFFRPPIASVGMTEQQAAACGPADIYITRFTPMRHALSGHSRQRTVMKLVVDQVTQVVVGAHMIGDDAPEIMQGLSIAMNCGATKADFDRTVGIHPTSAEEFVTLRTRTRVAEGPTEPEQDAQQVGAEEMGAAEMGLGA
jgi:glutathione reductase (NADPH)